MRTIAVLRADVELKRADLGPALPQSNGASPSSTITLCVRDRVIVHGLVGRTELNGCMGTVVSSRGEGRIGILVDGNAEPLALKALNLRLVAKAPAPAAAAARAAYCTTGLVMGEASPFDDAGVTVKVRQGRGRCAIALRALPAGLTIISSVPYAACLFEAHRPRWCEHCLKQSKGGGAMFPCNASIDSKCGTFYCSSDCRQADSEYHAHVCGLLVRDSPLQTRCDDTSRLYVLLAARCLWQRQDAATRDKGRHHESTHETGAMGAGPAELSEVDDRLFDQMTARQSGRPLAAEEEITLMATRLPGLMPPGTSFAALVDLQARLKRNAFSFADEAGNVIGVACHPRSAILNHSCAPNVVITPGDGGRMQLRTTCEVPAGSELCHSYTELCAPTRLRQLRLEKQHGFVCDCSRCHDGLWLHGESVDEAMDGTTLPAGDDNAAAKRQLEQSEELLERATRCRESAKAAALVEQALRARRQWAHPLSLQRYQAESAMCQLSLSSEEKVAECRRHKLSFLEAALLHVPWHPSLSLERMQQACSEALLGNRQAAMHLMSLVVPALMTTHGAEHALTKTAMMARSTLTQASDEVNVGQLLRPILRPLASARVLPPLASSL